MRFTQIAEAEKKKHLTKMFADASNIDRKGKPLVYVLVPSLR